MTSQPMTALELFIQKIKLPSDHVFAEATPVDLYRFQRNNQPRGLLAPRLSGIGTQGQFARGDLEVIPGDDNMGWVLAASGGVSLFDKPVSFRPNGQIFRLPRRTILPKGLVLTYDGFRPDYHAAHYTIHALEKMRVQNYEALLKELEKYLKPVIKR